MKTMRPNHHRGTAARRACLPLLLAVAVACPLLAGEIDTDGVPIYVRNGFRREWTLQIPGPDDKDWLVVPGVKSGRRSAVLKDLPLPGMPRRPLFSLREYPPREFTFIAEFSLREGYPPPNRSLGVFFANIGENWEVYLNGHLLRSELHTDGRGNITSYRHLREVLIPLDCRILKTGGNLLAVRILADPTNIDSGFHRSTPFIIDDYETLEQRRSDQAALILLFLYLFFGAYHIFIYFIRSEEKFYLFYGLFSVTLFVYLLTRTHAVYAVTLDSTVLHRIEYCSLYALLPLIGAFLDSLLTGSYSRFTRFFAAFYGLLILLTLLPFSNPFVIDILRVWQVTSVVPLFYYTLGRIGRAAWEHYRRVYRDYRHRALPARFLSAAGRTMLTSTAGNLLLGTVIMVGCAVFDILDSMFWAYDYVVSQYGFFIFMMGITLMLANRFLSIHGELEQANETARMEMNLATEVQLSLLETPPRDLKNWDVALTYMPKYGASGDCYDFYYREKTLQGLSLFDVAGHGVASALIGMLIKPITARLFRGMQSASLDDIYRHVNITISRELQRLDNFISGILLRFRDGEVEYVNAGHPDLLVRRATDGKVSAAGPGGTDFRGEPIGVNLMNIPPQVIRLRAEKDDVLMLFTDGIIESCNYHNVPFGLARVMESLQEARGGTARDILNHVVERFFTFINLEQIRDDYTIIVVRKR
ncbi:MAG: SpoIIE family protein phosphatase [Spirochaetes bacterium]|nr:SpoIIE family protein phosphatase [Spirochaetota bacterium]